MLPSDLLSRIIGAPLAPTDLVFTPDLIVVALISHARTALCPVCGQPSDRVHSRYRRVLADLPLCGRQLIPCCVESLFFDFDRPVKPDGPFDGRVVGS